MSNLGDEIDRLQVCMLVIKVNKVNKFVKLIKLIKNNKYVLQEVLDNDNITFGNFNAPIVNENGKIFSFVHWVS